MTRDPVSAPGAPPGEGLTGTGETAVARYGRDLLASLVVFMVALPLCIAIASACGLPPAAGIITGIIGGLVVGPLAGCPLQVSGPAAGLIVLVLDVVHEEGRGPAALAVVILLAGLMQLAAAGLQLGRYFRAVSPAVIMGMLAGIGVVIVAKQIHVMVDDDAAPSVVQNIASIPGAFAKALTPLPGKEHHQEAAAVGLLTIAILALWKPYAPKRLRIVPAALIAVVLAGVSAEVFDLRLRTPDVGQGLWDALHFLPLGTSEGRSALLTMLGDPWIWQTAAGFAVIASAETLLCATAVDQMHSGPRTQYNRELMGQGVGNTLCGLVGSLPMTGVIVRSSANVEAGARTRLSTILHGAWLLLFVAAMPWLLAEIPSAALGAILVYTGFKLVDYRSIVRLWREDRSEALILLATLTLVVVEDLLIGVATGIGLSVLKLVYRFTHLKVRRSDQAGRVDLYLEGAATFLRLPALATELDKVPPAATLHLHIQHLTYVDHACLELLTNWADQQKAKGGQVEADWDGLRARGRGPARAVAVVATPDGPSRPRPWSGAAERA